MKRKGVASDGGPFRIVYTEWDGIIFRTELRGSVPVRCIGGGWMGPDGIDPVGGELRSHLRAVAYVARTLAESEKQRRKRLGVKAEPSSYQVEALRWFELKHEVWKKSGGKLPKTSAMDVHNYLADWAAQLPEAEFKALTGDLPHEDTVGRWLRKHRAGT
jgi:hypothetical protein